MEGVSSDKVHVQDSHESVVLLALFHASVCVLSLLLLIETEHPLGRNNSGGSN